MSVVKHEEVTLNEIDKDTCTLIKMSLNEQKAKMELDAIRAEKAHFKLKLLKKYYKRE